MPNYDPSNSPEQNLAVLAENPYPGRLLVVGYCGQSAVQAYAIMGRSEPSRNRILTRQNDIISTEIFDTTQSVGDPELTIYDAIRQVGDYHVVTNGTQTNRAAQYLRSGRSFEDAMNASTYEPDPNATPRISAFIGWTNDPDIPAIGISVISKDPSSDETVRRFYGETDLGLDGLDGGYCVHTYEGDGDPLPSFVEPPFLLPAFTSATEMAGMIWENLNTENRVAVVAKTVNMDDSVDFSIINRHKLSGPR